MFGVTQNWKPYSENPKWGNPSESSSRSNSGWKDFLTHDLLFYDGSRPNGWDYVYEDSMKFSLRIGDQFLTT